MPFPALHLKADRLGCTIGDLRLFHGLSFALEPGTALIIRGPNGIGKTTLLRHLAGLHRPDEGTICVQDAAGQPTAIHDGNSCAHYLGHKNGLKPQLSVQNNLDFFRSFYGQGALSVYEAAARLHITNLLFLPVGALSAGQRRRVAIARLLVSPRPIWVLDEPTAALDLASSTLIETLCQEHLQQNGLLIAATHLPFLPAHMDNVAAIDLSDYRTQPSTKGYA